MVLSQAKIMMTREIGIFQFSGIDVILINIAQSGKYLPGDRANSIEETDGQGPARKKESRRSNE
jgi:hypothetical protein